MRVSLNNDIVHGDYMYRAIPAVKENFEVYLLLRTDKHGEVVQLATMFSKEGILKRLHEIIYPRPRRV